MPTEEEKPKSIIDKIDDENIKLKLEELEGVSGGAGGPSWVLTIIQGYYPSDSAHEILDIFEKDSYGQETKDLFNRLGIPYDACISVIE